MLTDCSDQSTQSATFHHPMPVEIISVVWDGMGNTEISNHCLHWYKRMNGSVLFSTEPSVASASWWICLSWAYVVFPVQHPPHPDVGSSAASLPILTVLNLPSVIFIWACWTFVSIITVSLLLPLLHCSPSSGTLGLCMLMKVLWPCIHLRLRTNCNGSVYTKRLDSVLS